MDKKIKSKNLGEAIATLLLLFGFSFLMLAMFSVGMVGLFEFIWFLSGA